MKKYSCPRTLISHPFFVPKIDIFTGVRLTSLSLVRSVELLSYTRLWYSRHLCTPVCYSWKLLEGDIEASWLGVLRLNRVLWVQRFSLVCTSCLPSHSFYTPCFSPFSIFYECVVLILCCITLADLSAILALSGTGGSLLSELRPCIFFHIRCLCILG